MWQLRIGDSQTVCLGDHAEVVARWEKATKERAIHVWSVIRTDWVEYDLFEGIPIASSATTILIRLPEVDDLSYLGVEMFALVNPTATILASKGRKRAAPSSEKDDELSAPPTKRVKRAPAASSSKTVGKPSRAVRAVRALKNAHAGPSTQGDLSAALNQISQGLFGLNDVL